MIHHQGLCSLVNGQTNEFLGVNHTRVHVNVEGWTIGGLAGFRSSTVCKTFDKKTPKVRERDPKSSKHIFQGRAASFLVCKY